MNHSLQRWEALHARAGFEPIYPAESVIRWSFRNFPRGTPATLLDVGAGHGRHALFWARSGYTAFATDAAVSAVDGCLDKAREVGLDVQCAVAGASSLPFSDSCFDGVLSYGVLYYLPWQDWQSAFDEVHRVLRPGGHALFVVRSTEDSRCTMGEVIAERSWRIASQPDCPWSAEVGLPMTFVGESDLRQLSKRFEALTLDRNRWSDRGGRYWNDDWLVQLRR